MYERSAPQNAWTSIHCTCWKISGCGSIFHLFLPISPQENNEKNGEFWWAFKPEEKMSSWRNDMIFSPWWKSVEFWLSIFFPKCRIGVECLTRGNSRWPLRYEHDFRGRVFGLLDPQATETWVSIRSLSWSIWVKVSCRVSDYTGCDETFSYLRAGTNDLGWAWFLPDFFEWHGAGFARCF
jgi:hypothetical protein